MTGSGTDIRVVAADDQPLMLEAFRMVLGAEPDIELVGVASNGLDAIAVVTALRPDVVLMDIRMPELDGVEATRRITAADDHVRVVILTTFELDEYVVEAVRAGASGFLLKDAATADLVRAIRVAAAGDALLAPSVARRLLDRVTPTLAPFRDARPSQVGALTDAELRVLTLVGRGLSNEEISRELFVSDSTVRTHIRHILDKLNLRDRIQAVVFAYDVGLIQPARR